MGRLASMARSEEGPDGGTYQVQYLRDAQKSYVCPGCLHPIALHSAHVVVWPEDRPYGLPTGVDARRHWHPECWRRKLRPR